jgi:predicted amidohydrolase
MLDLAEPIPDGESTRRHVETAAANSITILAGLFEKDDRGNLYKAHVCVDKTGLRAKFRNRHPFINPNLLPGDGYVVFEIGRLKVRNPGLLR